MKDKTARPVQPQPYAARPRCRTLSGSARALAALVGLRTTGCAPIPRLGRVKGGTTGSGPTVVTFQAPALPVVLLQSPARRRGRARKQTSGIIVHVRGWW